MPNGWFWYVNGSPNTFANHGYASTAARGLEFSIVHEPDGPHLQPGVVGGGERRIHDLSRRGQLGLGAAGAVTGPASTTLWVKGACSEEPVQDRNRRAPSQDAVNSFQSSAQARDPQHQRTPESRGLA